jgi:hypothetical protein
MPKIALYFKRVKSLTHDQKKISTQGRTGNKLGDEAIMRDER